MARIRSIKPGYFTSLDTAGSLSRDARLHFAGLWTYADDDGRGVDDPRLIKAAVWPLDEDIDSERVEELQDELARAGRIVRYEANGRRYFQVDNWHQHQKPNRPQESSIPPPDEGSKVPHASLSESAVNSHEQRSPVVEGRGEEKEGESATSHVDVSDDARRLTRLFAELAQANGHKPPARSSKANHDWLVEMDRLLRRGPPGPNEHAAPVDPTEVETVIRWCAADDFERANVASVGKLRKRYSQLRLKAVNAHASPPTEPFDRHDETPYRRESVTPR